MRDTKYAKELASARDDNGQTIEKLFVKGHERVEIRFSWWKDGKLTPRPLDLPEEELLELLGKAMVAGVFTDEFLRGLQTMLNGHLRAE